MHPYIGFLCTRDSAEDFLCSNSVINYGTLPFIIPAVVILLAISLVIVSRKKMNRSIINIFISLAAGVVLLFLLMGVKDLLGDRLNR